VAIVVLSLVASIGISRAVSANSYSQMTRLTLEMNDKIITEVLTAIEEQSEFIFFYQDGTIDNNLKVSVNAKDETVDKILDKLFASTDNSYLINDRQIFISRAEAAPDVTGAQTTSARAQAPQTRTVSGRVTDEAGEPLIGAMVSVSDNPLIATIAVVDGVYNLSNVPAGAMLTVQFLGYLTNEVSSGTGNEVNIVLARDVQVLDDVVVVGYGVQRKETLTGAVASISADEIMTTKTDNLINNVQGKVAGLFIRQRTGEPGAFDSAISVRGFGQPIVVIDGVVRNRGDWDKSGANELAQLNSEDIESFSVLKDGAAAIYGMNSANGVIIVTTKKGNSGNARVSYNGMFGMRMPTGMPKMVDAYTYRVMENEFQNNIGAEPKYPADVLQKYRDGVEGYTDHDWLDMYLKKAVPSTNHTLSVRGGSEKVGYYASVGYTKDNGLIKSNIGYADRFNLSASMNAQLLDNLKLNFNITGRADKSQREGEAFIWTYKSLVVNDRGVGPYTMANNGHLSYVGPEGKNPAALIDTDLEGYERNENQTAYATMDLTYTAPFIEGLSVNVLGAYDTRQEIGSTLNRKHQLYDYYTDTPAGSRGSVAYESRFQLYHKTYGKVQLNYSRTFGDHTVNALAAGEAAQERRDRLTGRRTYESDFYTSDIIDMGSPAGATNSGLREFRRSAAFLGRVNYDYRGKYLLEVMARYDGSFRYAPGRRWTLLPSASVGWRISEESFMKDNVSWINNLKLRASYGESGLDQGNLYQYLPAYTQAGNHGYVFNDGVTPGFYPPGVVNTNMSWVKSRIINVGVDLTVVRNLDVTIEWYERRLTGILANRVATAPNTFGASFPQENLNSERNLGLELAINYRGTIGEDFKYTVGGNISYTRFEWLHRERGKFNSQWDRWKEVNNFDQNSNRFRGGGWLYDWDGRYTSLADYETAPLQNGGARGNTRMLPGQYRIVDTNGDGRINGDDEQLLGWGYGDVNPPLQFGFNVDGSYKSWDFSLLFQGASLYALNYRNNDIWGYGRYPTLHEKFLDRWHTAPQADGVTPQNPLDPNSQWIPGKYPAGRPYNYENTTDANITNVWRPNATYLRLKNIEIGYTLPKTALDKIGISGLRVYANATNMLTFTRKELKEYDPEKWENEWDAGLSYPIMKAINFGINISF
jgi:TonB-linked SusC/RagA family outer membrane protein